MAMFNKRTNMMFDFRRQEDAAEHEPAGCGCCRTCCVFFWLFAAVVLSLLVIYGGILHERQKSAD